MAYSGKKVWLVENAIWKWAGCDDSTVLCMRCFHADVLKKLGKTNNNDEGPPDDPLVAAALAGLLPIASDVAHFDYLAFPLKDFKQLDVVLALLSVKGEIFLIGLSEGHGTAIRCGRIRWEGKHLVFKKPESPLNDCEKEEAA
jgi:hypothetical protein